MVGLGVVLRAAHMYDMFVARASTRSGAWEASSWLCGTRLPFLGWSAPGNEFFRACIAFFLLEGRGGRGQGRGREAGNRDR